MNQQIIRRGKIKTPPTKEVIDNIVAPNLKDAIGRTFWAYVDLNRAHVLMLAEQGIISKETEKAILKVNEELAQMGERPTFEIDPRREDLYFNLEHYLIDRVGLQVGGQQHTARSRNDMTSTVTRMVARRLYFLISERFLSLRRTLLTLAKANEDAVMAGYTHLQPSEPITFAHYCSAILAEMQRDYRRFSAVYGRLNQCPLGGTSMGSSTWNIDRKLTSRLLGFDGPIDNSIDCVATRDYVLEFISSMAIAGNAICRFCNDLYLWATPDYGYIEVDDSVAVCSSIMPQKKNPWTLEFIKGKTASLEGDFVSAMSTMRTTPYTYCLDLSGVAVSNLWHAGDQMKSALELLQATLRGLKVNKSRMLATARSNYCTVTELANTLVRKDGISFREAHEIVAQVVDWMLRHGKKANDITTDVINTISQETYGFTSKLTQREVDIALDPLLNANSKTIIGGTAPTEVTRQLSSIEKALSEDEQEHKNRLAALKAAKDAMVSAVQKALNS